MAKNEKVTYSDEERFDAQFKKRQSEIINEISIWSQSESFRSRTREVIRSALNEHDELVSLSKRLFGIEAFTTSFEELTQNVNESSTHKT